MTTTTTRPKRAELVATVERLERTTQRMEERLRSLSVLLERAEADRDEALWRLRICARTSAHQRDLLLEARATIAALTASPEGGWQP